MYNEGLSNIAAVYHAMVRWEPLFQIYSGDEHHNMSGKLEIGDLMGLEGIDILQIKTGDNKLTVLIEPMLSQDDVLLDGRTYILDGIRKPPILQLHFSSCMAFMVADKEYSSGHLNEQYEGGAIRVYTKSMYLDFTGKYLIKDFINMEPVIHYAVQGKKEVVDILTTQPPTVSYYIGKSE